MTKTLRKSYQKYLAFKPKKNQLLDFFRRMMPEIVYRSTKLEGESVSRRQVYSIFAGK